MQSANGNGNNGHANRLLKHQPKPEFDLVATAEMLKPSNIQAERCVLGNMLHDNDVIADVMMILTPDMFYADCNVKIATIIFSAHDSGKPIDLVILADELHSKNMTADVGGVTYLSQLWEDGYAPATATYHAKYIQGAAIRRKLIDAAKETLADAYFPTGDADFILEAAQKRFMAIGDVAAADHQISTAKLVSRTISWIDRRKERAETDGVLTGYYDIDHYTGGLQNGELTIIAARPSLGKTALAANIAANIGRKSHPALFFSLEQSGEEIGCRLLCAEAAIDGRRVRNGDCAEMEIGKIIDASNHVSAWPIEWDDNPSQTLMRISSSCRRAKRKFGVPRAVFIDYLQLITVDPGRENREQQVAGITRRLKLLAREMKIPVVVLCQLNRQSENRADKEPQLFDLRESGSIEQDADCVFMLWRREGNTSVIDVKIAKQRNGPLATVQLLYNAPYTRFENYAAPAPGYIP